MTAAEPYLIATIGNGSASRETMRALLEAGARILRFNWATRGPDEELLRRSTAARAAAEDSARPCEIMVDLPVPGTKIRMRTHERCEFPVPRGTVIRFVDDAALVRDPKDIVIELPGFAAGLRRADCIIVGDGEIAFEVVRREGPRELVGVSLCDWYLSDSKSVSFPGCQAGRSDGWQARLEARLEALVACRPEIVALSFVRDDAVVESVRAALRAALGYAPRIMAKIEDPEAVQNAEQIARAADIVAVARGDLALTAPFETLGLAQRTIVRAAQRVGREVVVATQILETTMTRYVPNRCEIVDLTNAVLDGVDGFLLAKETSAVGNPVHAVVVARRIVAAAWAARGGLR